MRPAYWPTLKRGLALGGAATSPTIDHGPVQVMRTRAICPSQLSPLSKKTSLLVRVLPRQRPRCRPSTSISTPCPNQAALISVAIWVCSCSTSSRRRTFS